MLDLGRRCRTVVLQSGDHGTAGKSWVVWRCRGCQGTTSIPTIGHIVEIVQIHGSQEERYGIASFVTIQRAITGEWHSIYGMQQLELTDEYVLVKPEVLSSNLSC